MSLVLASFSRARADLLRAAGYSFTQQPSGVDERPYVPGEDPAAYVQYLAEQKATAVAREHPQDVVIGADTVLFMDGRTFGKPTDLEAAVAMLKVLRGRTHRLLTGVCAIGPGGEEKRVGHDEVLVTMRNWSDAHIERHIEIAKPLAFAGAYALQQEGSVMVERIEGDPNTVIGLPMGLAESFILALDPTLGNC